MRQTTEKNKDFVFCFSCSSTFQYIHIAKHHLSCHPPKSLAVQLTCKNNVKKQLKLNEDTHIRNYEKGWAKEDSSWRMRGGERGGGRVLRAGKRGGRKGGEGATLAGRPCPALLLRSHPDMELLSYSTQWGQLDLHPLHCIKVQLMLCCIFYGSARIIAT